jgi:predicted  nucleic acid-binding Zn-ribbon protein
MTDEVREKLARLEEKVDNISSEIGEIKKEIQTLQTHVNEEIKEICSNITSLQKKIIHLDITQKILTYIAGLVTAGVVGLLIDLARRVIFGH